MNHIRGPRTLIVLVACALALACGCGGPATFVSPTPPPGTTGDAWYARPPASVRTALGTAIAESGLVLDDSRTDRNTLVGSRQQVPYVGDGAGELAAGPLPLYRVTVGLSSDGSETHVRATVQVVCSACDGSTPYEWEYPSDVIRSIFEKTRKILGVGKPRYRYPARHVPPKWRPPRRR